MVPLELIEAVPLLRPLSAPARAELAARASVARFAPGTVLWRAGGRPRGLFIVTEGTVRVVRGRGGRQHVIHTEGPGGTLGDVALFSGDAYPATAIAASRVACLVLDREAIAAATRLDPSLALALLERLARRVHHLVDRVDSLALSDVRARVAGFLLRRHERTGAEFTLGATQHEVAEELGTVREVVARTLRELRDQGVLEATGRARLAIRDVERLRAIAGRA